MHWGAADVCCRLVFLLCRADHTRERLLNRDREAFASKRDDVDLNLVKELDTEKMYDMIDE